MGTDMNELDHELIERYLSGEMDADTKAAFEGRLEKEPELLHTLQTWRDVEETLRHSLQPDAQRDELKKTLKPETVLVSVMYVNNEIGTIQPVKEIAKLIRWYKKQLPPRPSGTPPETGGEPAQKKKGAKRP